MTHPEGLSPRPSPELFVVGAATTGSMIARLPLLAGRARAAAACGKSLRDFVRESGRDWVEAPCRLAVLAESLAELDEKLQWAASLLSAGGGQAAAPALEERGVFFGCPALEVEAAAPPRRAIGAPSGHGAVGGPADGQQAPGLSAERGLAGGQLASGLPAVGLPAGGQLASGLPAVGLPAGGQALNGEASEGAPSDGVRETVLATAAQKTGYELESLGLDLDLQADLGIDSLKHAEVIETLWAHYGVPCDETVFVVDYPTLGHMVSHLASCHGGPRPSTGRCNLGAPACALAEPLSVPRDPLVGAASDEAVTGVQDAAGMPFQGSPSPPGASAAPGRGEARACADAAGLAVQGQGGEGRDIVAATAPLRSGREWLTTVLSDREVSLDIAVVARALQAEDALVDAILARADERERFESLAEGERLPWLAVRVAACELVARATGEAAAAVELAPEPGDQGALRAIATGAPLAAVSDEPLAERGATLKAITASAPLTAWRVLATVEGGAVRARLDGEPRLDASKVTAFWRAMLGGAETAVAHVTEALMQKFVREVRVEDAAGLAAVRGGPLIFLSNHQTAVEMYTFPLLAAALGGRIVEGVAMRDHGVDWADPMRDFLTSHGDIPREKVAPARAIDTSDPREVLRVIPELERDLRSGDWSLLIAVEGGRERVARHTLRHMSSVWLDLALAVGSPIVPVRFRGGVPLEDPGVAQDLPLGFGTQSILLGRPLLADQLQAIPAAERKACVLQALNGLGPPETEEPHPPDAEFGTSVATWLEYTGGPAILGVLFRALERSRPLPGFVERAGRHVLGCATDAFVVAGRLGFALRQPVALVLPPTADGLWVKTLATMTFGPGGPRVCEPGEVPDEVATVVTVEVESHHGR